MRETADMIRDELKLRGVKVQVLAITEEKNVKP